MTTTVPTVPAAAPARTRTRAAVRFAGHYLEMVLAMAVGMAALAPVWRAAWPAITAHPDVETITMALDMTLAMGAWMRLRGHPWRHVTRMCVAMDLGFVAVLPAYWLGVLSAGGMESLGHGLMLLLMFLAMLRNPPGRTS